MESNFNQKMEVWIDAETKNEAKASISKMEKKN